MIDAPMTVEEARKHVYGVNLSARRYAPGYCAYEVWRDMWQPHQCNRKNGHGPDGLYCKQHGKMVAARPAPAKEGE